MPVLRPGRAGRPRAARRLRRRPLRLAPPAAQRRPPARAARGRGVRGGGRAGRVLGDARPAARRTRTRSRPRDLVALRRGARARRRAVPRRPAHARARGAAIAEDVDSADLSGVIRHADLLRQRPPPPRRLRHRHALRGGARGARRGRRSHRCARVRATPTRSRAKGGPQCPSALSQQPSRSARPSALARAAHRRTSLPERGGSAIRSFSRKDALLRKARTAGDRAPRVSAKINEQIVAREVRLVESEGEQLGVLARDDARAYAYGASSIWSRSRPTRTRPSAASWTTASGATRRSERLRASRRNQVHVSFKEVRLRPKIGEHDYEWKRDRAAEFLRRASKVKLVVLFRGREREHPERGRALLERMAEDVKEVGHAEGAAVFEGRRMTMVLAPTARAPSSCCGPRRRPRLPRARRPSRRRRCARGAPAPAQGARARVLGREQPASPSSAARRNPAARSRFHS